MNATISNNLIVGDYVDIDLDQVNANGEQYPGMVVLMNKAIIENGSVATLVTDRLGTGGGANYYGGIVYGENSTFQYCRKAAAFMPYRYAQL